MNFLSRKTYPKYIKTSLTWLYFTLRFLPFKLTETMNNTEMTMDDRMELIDSIVDDMWGLCECFAEAEEEDNCRAVFEEFDEWFDGRECQVWWVPNFADVL